MRLASTLYACARANQNSGPWSTPRLGPLSFVFRVRLAPLCLGLVRCGLRDGHGCAIQEPEEERARPCIRHAAYAYACTAGSTDAAPPARFRRGRTSIALPSSWSCSRSGNVTEHAILGRTRYPKEPIVQLAATARDTGPRGRRAGGGVHHRASLGVHAPAGGRHARVRGRAPPVAPVEGGRPGAQRGRDPALRPHRTREATDPLLEGRDAMKNEAIENIPAKRV